VAKDLAVLQSTLATSLFLEQATIIITTKAFKTSAFFITEFLKMIVSELKFLFVIAGCCQGLVNRAQVQMKEKFVSVNEFF
jgi:hypothetical protein